MKERVFDTRTTHKWGKWKRQKEPKKTDFMDFVDRVLPLSKNSSIKECHLLFLDAYDPFRLKTWITAALRANVPRLCISYEGNLVFPRWFFTFDSLTRLKLKLCKFKIPMTICNSNHRTLDIHDIEFQNADPSSHISYLLCHWRVSVIRLLMEECE